LQSFGKKICENMFPVLVVLSTYITVIVLRPAQKVITDALFKRRMNRREGGRAV